ncbi:MAG: polyribonucleotide nucleotidyltransferase [Flavobacteriales bacterium]
MNKEGIYQNIEVEGTLPISIETGRLAKQADGSAVVRMGNTMLLATVVSAKEKKEGMNFLPLTVEYKDKFASSGKFPGGFIKREARPNEHEILTSRLVDRAIRPLFPEDYRYETQVLISLISSDLKQVPDALACLAASAALSVSDIPFSGPVSEVRVAKINGEFHINPDISTLEEADMDLIVAGTKENIMMVEGEMNEIPEKDIVEALKSAHKAINVHCNSQEELRQKVMDDSSRFREYEGLPEDKELESKVRNYAYDKIKEIAALAINDKHERKAKLKEVREGFIEEMSDEEREEKEDLAKDYFGIVEKDAVRDMILNDKKRLDGRSYEQIREIWSEVDYLPGTHGSAIFTRGETQSLATLTLGTKLDEQTVDGAVISGSESFMLHYNFPPFCTGEAKPIRGTSRREVGHGNLAQRALKKVMPSDEENPYTVRVVSDILESNGSSSMATVCSGTMALMDAGINISNPVSGIAMGLVMDKENKDNYAVLSDILGDEDMLGDMDFKVTGTEQGVTACQMDIKVDGLSFDVLEKALEQAKEGRLHILNEMKQTIDSPRKDLKDHAPRIVSLQIPEDKIGEVIGPGGKFIQELQNETGATITVENDDDNGTGQVEISSENKGSLDSAIEKVKEVAYPPVVEVGEVYDGKVKSIMPYGAFVEIVPNTDGLLHISEIAWKHVKNVEDELKEGDEIQVKVKDKDPKTGKLKLSRKVLFPKPEQEEQQS